MIDQYRDAAKQGLGLEVDAGCLFQPVKTHFSPKFGASVTNIGDTFFSPVRLIAKELKVSDNAPFPVPMSVNAGVSINPKLFGSRFWFMKLAVEGHGINRPLVFEKMIRGGVEFGYEGLKLKGSLKAGYMNAGLTYGFEFDFVGLKIVYSSYVMEQGVQIGSRPQRRHLVSTRLFL